MIRKAKKKALVTRVLEKVWSRYNTTNQCNQFQEKLIYYSSTKRWNKGTNSVPHSGNKRKED